MINLERTYEKGLGFALGPYQFDAVEQGAGGVHEAVQCLVGTDADHSRGFSVELHGDGRVRVYSYAQHRQKVWETDKPWSFDMLKKTLIQYARVTHDIRSGFDQLVESHP